MFKTFERCVVIFQLAGWLDEKLNQNKSDILQ